MLKRKRSTGDIDGTEHNSGEKNKDGRGGEGNKNGRRGGERESDTSVSGMTSLCTAAVFVNQGRPGVFAGLFLSEKGGKRGRTKSKTKKSSCDTFQYQQEMG